MNFQQGYLKLFTQINKITCFILLILLINRYIILDSYLKITQKWFKMFFGSIVLFNDFMGIILIVSLSMIFFLFFIILGILCSK